MKRIIGFVLAFATSGTLLISCQKESQQTASASTSIQQPSAQHQGNYGPGAVYEIELSANISGVQGGGVWLWIGLYPDGTGDYSGADCGHGGAGATNDKGDVTWHYSTDHQWVVINGVMLNGLDGFPTTITVPSAYGHYTGTIGTYMTLPGFIPGFLGNTQLQVAR